MGTAAALRVHIGMEAYRVLLVLGQVGLSRLTTAIMDLVGMFSSRINNISRVSSR